MILFEAFKPVWVSLTEEGVKEEAEGCGRRGERCPWRYRGFAPLGRTALKRPFVSKWLQLVMKMHVQANESILRSWASDSLWGTVSGRGHRGGCWGTVTLCVLTWLVPAAPRVRFVKLHQAQHVIHGHFSQRSQCRSRCGLNSSPRDLRGRNIAPGFP